MRIGSLCSGAGGLDMAVEKVFGATTAWHCEINDAASQVLEFRYPDVPNHRDLIETDWLTVEPIDIFCAGWPCQPFSLAGKRKGADDERAIWPHVARAIRILRPRIILLENVSAVLVSEFGRVADSLGSLGYDIRWACVRASDIGAPHRRERLFIVATDTQRDGPRRETDDARRRESDTAGRGWGSEPEGPGATSGGGSSEVELLQTPSAADGDGSRKARGGDRSNEPLLPGQAVEMASTWGKYDGAIHRWESLTRPAPPPTEPNTKGLPRLNPAFSEWMMGWPAGWVTDVPGISRNDQLRIIGNGVVPQAAEAALRWLLNVQVAA